MTLRINQLKMMLAAVCSSLLLFSCTVEQPSYNYGALKAQFSSATFDVEAGGTISLPFAVVGVEGAELELSAQASSPDASVSVSADIFYQGTVEFTAPAVTAGETITVTLTVTDAAHKRSAEAKTQVQIGASESLAIALKNAIQSVALKPSGSFTLPVVITGSDNVNISDAVQIEVPSGYSASFQWDNDKKGGVITVNAPSALSDKVSVKMTISDDHSRTATLDVTLAVVEVTITAGAANCYIVKPGSTLTINAVEGNSADKVEFDSAELVWQDCVAMVKSVSAGVSDNVIVVELNSGLSGNAVVAAKKDGVITWSWHIWVCDYNPDEDPMVWTSSSSGKTYTYMDRNLGAASAEKYSHLSFGLLYQWGRKDPFVGADGVMSSVFVKMYDIDGNQVRLTGQLRPVYDGADYESTNLMLSIQNPTVYYWAPSSAWPVVDWYTDKAALQNNDLWGGVSNIKTKYDPCPEGWEVPGAGDCWKFRSEYKKDGNLNDASSYDSSYPWYIDAEAGKDSGFRYRFSDTGKEYWFPFAGKIGPNSFDLSSVGGGANYHTRTTENTLAKMQIFAWGNPASETGLNRPYAASIRCVKVQE